MSAWLVMGAVLMIALAGPKPARAQDGANFYTTFSVSKTAINWTTCGSTQQSEGCFGAGSISPFGNVCAVLQGLAVTVGNTVNQKLYVFDSDYKSSGNVFLHVFKKTVVITSSTLTTTFTPERKIGLALTGGSKVTCYAAANAHVIVAGTSASFTAVEISKANLATASIGGFSPPEPVTSIVADDRGYIVVNQGNGTGTGFYLLGPNGGGVEDGGGNVVIFNSENAYIP
jgi:hypothetical protein